VSGQSADIITSSSPASDVASLASSTTRDCPLRDREPNSPLPDYWRPLCEYLRVSCFVLRIPVPIRPVLCEEKPNATDKSCECRIEVCYYATTLTCLQDTTAAVPSSCRPIPASLLKPKREIFCWDRSREMSGLKIIAIILALTTYLTS
jgi:hypothetical protein